MKFRDRFNDIPIRARYSYLFEKRNDEIMIMWLDGDFQLAQYPSLNKNSIFGPAKTSIDGTMEYFLRGKKVSRFDVMIL